jgi:hypothetical protein
MTYVVLASFLASFLAVCGVYVEWLWKICGYFVHKNSSEADEAFDPGAQTCGAIVARLRCAMIPQGWPA